MLLAGGQVQHVDQGAPERTECSWSSTYFVVTTFWLAACCMPRSQLARAAAAALERLQECRRVSRGACFQWAEHVSARRVIDD